MDITRYKGMSYEQLSRKAAELIERAHKTGSWHDIVDTLVFMRGEMRLRLSGVGAIR